MPPKIRVLVVDDSLITTQAITRILQADPDLEVVGRALDGEKALVEVERLKPDVVTMDINMPAMDGITATRAIVKRFGTPIVIVSAYASAHGIAIQTLQALMSGAIESVQKPSGAIGLDLDMVGAELVAKVKATARARPPRAGGTGISRGTDPLFPAPGSESSWTSVKPASLRLVAIGVSTGGPSTLEQIVPKLPADYPAPIAIVIHMPDMFIPILAEMLGGSSAIPVAVARDGESLRPGRVHLAPASVHMEVTPDLRVRLVPGDPVNGCIPSVDVLFHSIARSLGARTLGLVLTGMGRDGAAGLAAMRAQGSITAAQDAGTSVIYGMPKAATTSGAATYQVPLPDVAPFLCRAAGR